MSFDLLNLGRNATLAHQRSLQITGNNIANVNTAGYIRERPVYNESSIGYGLDRLEVERMVDQFTQRQVRVDTSRAAFTDTYLDQATRIDTVLGRDEGSVATAIEKFFDLMQDTNNDPGSLTYRELLLTEGEGVAARMREMGEFLENQYDQFNDRLDLEVDRANNLIESISELNKEISSYTSTKKEKQGALNTLLNDRDEKLRELSEYADIRVTDFSNGRQNITLATGQSLVMEDGTFNLIALKGDPNPLRPELTTQTRSDGKLVDVPVDVTRMGGTIGGMVAYRDEVLEPTQFKLGQMAMGFADALNEQNRLGMDLDNELGGVFFDLSNTETTALPHTDTNTGTNQRIDVRLEAGKAAELTAHRYEVRIQPSGTEFQVVALDTNGRMIGDETDYPVGTIGAAGDWEGDLGIGMEFNFADGTFDPGDRFEVNFTQNAALNIDVGITRPEDIALAAPVRVGENPENSGGGEISFEGMDSVDNFFDGTNNELLNDAPVQIRYEGRVGSTHQLSIIDNDGNTVGYFEGTNMDNILDNAVEWNGTGAFPDMTTTPTLYDFTPDYDVSLSGNPDAGDSFDIEYNSNGFADNSNSLAMSELQREKTLRRNPIVEGEKNMMSFNEGYGRMVSDVGNKVSQARTSDEASKSLLEQSTSFFESVSGVNLDEEASNLLKYEQSYNAAARIITVSQTIFDTLLSSTR
ncbi:flagellar hook-associated protein FlgK [Aliidiomarina sedimenti]|uniref:Flagellar hook-associated protein 1 n=1 Tax=Aliidiomarina sedimenti TaxID=1933879 RepID=A0ABY0BYW5_9GAMM|nr:flagellar hook-associated protein FlgK [Aliidiomarina sedimenti]RUO29888.1 flagellar hook-associated protein FlgK [Aliidiomarina sedimenti]